MVVPSGAVAESGMFGGRAAGLGSATRLITGAGIDVTDTAIFYPPCGSAAALLAPWDSWLGCRTTINAAFLVVAGRKAGASTDQS